MTPMRACWAAYFEKHTGATVVVENKPGAGGITSLNQLVRGDGDGLTFQMLNGEASILSQLTKKAGVAYDMNKVGLIARVEQEPHFMLVNPKMSNDIKAILVSGKKVKFSAGSRTDNLGDYAAVLCEALQMSCQIITGYKGSKGASLALFNGEADALTISESSGLRYASGGKAKIIITIGHGAPSISPISRPSMRRSISRRSRNGGSTGGSASRPSVAPLSARPAFRPTGSLIYRRCGRTF